MVVQAVHPPPVTGDYLEGAPEPVVEIAAGGILHSTVFPGLRLAVEALSAGDAADPRPFRR